MEETGGQGGQLEIVDPDTAERAFRTRTSFGLEVSDEFTRYKDLLADLYETIRLIIENSAEDKDFEYPDADVVFRAFRGYLKDLGRRQVDASDDFFRLCLLLASQKPPFIYILREIDGYQSSTGQFVTRTRLLLASRRIREVPGQAFARVIRRSFNAIRDGYRQGDAYPDWPALLRQAGEGEDPRPEDLRRGRIDALLRRLNLRESPGQDDLRPMVARSNAIIESFILRPLLRRMLENDLALMVTVAPREAENLAGAEKPAEGPRRDFVYPNAPEQLVERQTKLGLFLTTNGFRRHLPGAGGESFARLPRLSAFELYSDNAGEGHEGSIATAAEELYQSSDYAALPPVWREVVAELASLVASDRRRKQREAEAEEAMQLQREIQKIRRKQGLYLAAQNGKLAFSEELTRRFLRGEIGMVLAAAFPDPGGSVDSAGVDLRELDAIWLLHKDRECVDAACESAIEALEKQKDDRELIILERMLQLEETPESRLLQFISPNVLSDLRAAIAERYRRKLPWYVRLWNYFTGREPDERWMLDLRRQEREQDRRRFASLQKAETKRRTVAGREQIEARRNENASAAEARSALAALNSGDAAGLERSGSMSESASGPGGGSAGAPHSALINVDDLDRSPGASGPSSDPGAASGGPRRRGGGGDAVAKPRELSEEERAELKQQSQAFRDLRAALDDLWNQGALPDRRRVLDWLAEKGAAASTAEHLTILGEADDASPDYPELISVDAGVSRVYGLRARLQQTGEEILGQLEAGRFEARPEQAEALAAYLRRILGAREAGGGGKGGANDAADEAELDV